MGAMIEGADKEMGHLPSIINFDTCPHVKEWDTCSSSSQFAPNGSCLQSSRVRITWIVRWDFSYNLIWKYFLALAWWLAQLKRARAITVKCVLNIRVRKTVNWPKANSALLRTWQGKLLGGIQGTWVSSATGHFCMFIFLYVKTSWRKLTSMTFVQCSYQIIHIHNIYHFHLNVCQTNAIQMEMGRN